MNPQSNELDAGPADTSAAAAAGGSFWTLPNFLTLGRVATAPLFLAVFVLTSPQFSASNFGLDLGASWDVARAGLLACLVICLFSELSDLLDGMVARSTGQVSDFGKLMDPYADSTYRLTVFFCLASPFHGSWLPIWVVVLMWYRDMITAIIRLFAMRTGLVVAARWSGKIKAWVQASAMLSLVGMAVVFYKPQDNLAELPIYSGWKLGAIGFWLGLVAAVYSVSSGIEYLVANRNVFKGLGKK